MRSLKSRALLTLNLETSLKLWARARQIFLILTFEIQILLQKFLKKDIVFHLCMQITLMLYLTIIVFGLQEEWSAFVEVKGSISTARKNAKRQEMQ